LGGKMGGDSGRGVVLVTRREGRGRGQGNNDNDDNNKSKNDNSDWDNRDNGVYCLC
jgi:hypothetical protein